MKTEWRPDDWVGIKKKICFDQFHKGLSFAGINSSSPQCKSCSSTPDKCQKAVEVGASAMLSAVVKWLDESCDKHGNSPRVVRLEGEYGYSQAIIDTKRKDCPQCMTELRESMNE
jgi:hypothetical protein